MKKILFTLLTFLTVLILSTVIFVPTLVEAAEYTEGYYTYTVSDGKATITNVDTSISGAVEIPATLGGYTVTSIGDLAFSDCRKLTSITIPDGVTVIGISAFKECDSLEGVYITDIAAWCKISFKNYESSPLRKAGKLYLNGNLITDVVIPEGVTSIGNWAFSGSDTLKSIIIPGSVTSIGENAFQECSRLTSVTIQDGVTGIESYAFSRCSSLKSITIPDSVTYIEEDAFYVCTSLSRVEITDIAAWCKISFENYYSSPLQASKNDIYLNGNLLTDIVIPEGITSIEICAFRYCTSLKSITIPNSVTSIGERAFYGCSGLTSITIPDNVTSIGENAFAYSGLRSVTIGKGVTSLHSGYANDVFLNTNIKNAKFTHGRTSITDKFSNPTKGLNEVSFTNSVVDISPTVFSSSLKIVNFGGTRAEWEAMVYSGDEQFSNATIICTCLDNAHVYDNASDYTCNACDYTKDPCAAGHSYKTTWSKDGSKHWYECSVCSAKKDEATHTYDNACDTTCNTCGYTRTTNHSYKTTWEKDSAKHWHECSVCGSKKDEGNHVYDNNGDTTCNTCGYTRQVQTTPSVTTKPETTKPSTTTPSTTTPPTSSTSKNDETTAGDTTTSPDTTTTTDSTTAPDTTVPDVTIPDTTDSGKGSGNKDNDNTTTVIIIVVASVAVIGGGTAVTLILKKKK